MAIADFATSADVARAYIECMSNKDMETFKALMLPDAKYQLLPRSLKRPANGPEGVAALFEAFYKLIPDLHVDIDEINESEGKVWVHAYGFGKSLDGRGNYENEYVMMFDIVRNEEGALRISRVREFCDSKFVADFLFGKDKKQLEGQWTLEVKRCN